MKPLSFAGRLQLISSVIYGLVNFWFTAFSLPKGCLKDIEKLCNRFLWVGDLSRRTSAKVSWKEICLPKSEGGLGLRNLLVWNKSLNLKLVWLLFSSSGSLWVAWMREHRFKRNSFWSIEVKITDSWIWKFLMALRNIAKALLSCTVGDGKQISFWFDNWCEHGPLILFVGENGPRLMGIPAQSSLANAYISHDWHARSRSRNVNIAALRTLLQNMIPPSNSRGNDVFLWGPHDHKSNDFSTKKTWGFLRPRQNDKPWVKAVWFKSHVPKHAFNFWVTNLDRLPVNARLVKWGLNVISTCTFCQLHDENRDHLFLQCHFSTQVWKLVLFRLGYSYIPYHSWDGFIQWLLSRNRPAKLKLLIKLACQTTVYLLWRERNTRIFDNLSMTPEALFKKIDRTIRDTLLARRHQKGCLELLSTWFTFS